MHQYHFYQKLSNTLKQSFQNDFPHLYIALESTQTISSNQRPSIDFPAILINFPSVNFSETQAPHYIASASLSLKIYTAPFQNANMFNPQEQNFIAFDHFQIAQKTIHTIHQNPSLYHPSIQSQHLLPAHDTLNIIHLLFLYTYTE